MLWPGCKTRDWDYGCVVQGRLRHQEECQRPAGPRSTEHMQWLPKPQVEEEGEGKVSNLFVPPSNLPPWPPTGWAQPEDPMSGELKGMEFAMSAPWDTQNTLPCTGRGWIWEQPTKRSGCQDLGYFSALDLADRKTLYHEKKLRSSFEDATVHHVTTCKLHKSWACFGKASCTCYAWHCQLLELMWGPGKMAWTLGLCQLWGPGLFLNHTTDFLSLSSTVYLSRLNPYSYHQDIPISHSPWDALCSNPATLLSSALPKDIFQGLERGGFHIRKWLAGGGEEG